nr:unnamed protein product [Callosobruchus analis]
MTEHEQSLNRDWSDVFKNDRLNSFSQTVLQARAAMPETETSMRFCTGSSYRGGYNNLGFAGLGVYIYPHGK